jgi:hypothetical protein
MLLDIGGASFRLYIVLFCFSIGKGDRDPEFSGRAFNSRLGKTGGGVFDTFLAEFCLPEL